MSDDPVPQGDYVAHWRIRELLGGGTYTFTVGLDGEPTEEDLVEAIADGIGSDYVVECAIEYKRMDSDEPWKSLACEASMNKPVISIGQKGWEAGLEEPGRADRDSVPMLFDVCDLVEHFDVHGPPNVQQLSEALGRVGRNQGPALLLCLHCEHLLDPDVAAAHVGAVWNAAEYPDAYLDHDDWRTMFEMAGYTRNGVRVDRPAKPLTLYRGSVPTRRADWSWTDRLDVAIGYAEGTRPRRPTTGRVWQAVVDPWRLLARNEGPDNRDEAEYVVDTKGLVIVEHGLSPHDGVALDTGRPR